MEHRQDTGALPDGEIPLGQHQLMGGQEGLGRLHHIPAGVVHNGQIEVLAVRLPHSGVTVGHEGTGKDGDHQQKDHEEGAPVQPLPLVQPPSLRPGLVGQVTGQMQGHLHRPSQQPGAAQHHGHAAHCRPQQQTARAAGGQQFDAETEGHHRRQPEPTGIPVPSQLRQHRQMPPGHQHQQTAHQQQRHSVLRQPQQCKPQAGIGQRPVEHRHIFAQPIPGQPQPSRQHQQPCQRQQLPLAVHTGFQGIPVQIPPQQIQGEKEQEGQQCRLTVRLRQTAHSTAQEQESSRHAPPNARCARRQPDAQRKTDGQRQKQPGRAGLRPQREQGRLPTGGLHPEEHHRLPDPQQRKASRQGQGLSDLFHPLPGEHPQPQKQSG